MARPKTSKRKYTRKAPLSVVVPNAVDAAASGDTLRDLINRYKSAARELLSAKSALRQYFPNSAEAGELIRALGTYEGLFDE